MKVDQFKLFINVKVTAEMGGNNALLYASNASPINEEIVKYLITEAGADIDTMNDYKANCLLMATKRGQKNVLYLLLENGVDISFTDKNGCNALHIACNAGHADVVLMLLRYWNKQKFLAKKRLKVKNQRVLDFDINSMDNNSATSLMKASMNRDPEIVRILLNFGANPRITN